MKAAAGNRRAAVREKAEKIIQEKTERLRDLSKDDVAKLVHELGVHQIELEMRNEKLRQAQEAMEASRRRYAELYEFAPAGYFTFDRNAVILGVNQTGARLLGTEKRELLRKPFSQFIADPADRERFRALITRISDSEAGKAIDVKLRGKEIIFDARLQFFFGEETGGQTCCKAMVIDITERKQLEDALRVSEEKYRLLFDRSPLAKWVLDLETFAFLEVNDAAVDSYGYSREEFLKLSLAGIRTRDEFNKFERAVEESIRRESSLKGAS